ncbi:caspase-14-like isoform X3 [Artibeus jamaicensis]|uniref:caspase-14-like isoform X3 n=1 Tax=Artibeus jamaicensis TaxID=9417 RepID=UPI00235AB762|nr:caspase-14-like isoform X3 [Artibeus jamaicensis]
MVEWPRVVLQVFSRTAEESSGVVYCPVLRSSLRGTLCLGNVEPWRPEPEPSPSAQYDMSGDRAALLLAVIRDRPGAQHDVDALGGLCQALGFETTLRTDPTAQAFQEELVQFQERLDTHRSPVSCALVALMAHGGPQGQLLGADGQEVQPEVFVRELSRCRALRGCPKIFLLQACRGRHRDAGMGRTALPWFRRWLWAAPATPSHADVLQVYADVRGSSFRGRAPGSRDQADALVVYAAAEGKGVAIRKPRETGPSSLAGGLEWLWWQLGLGTCGTRVPIWLQLGRFPVMFIIYNNSNAGERALLADMPRAIPASFPPG